MTDREAMQMALKTLEGIHRVEEYPKIQPAITALRAALEQQAEPVAWWHKKSDTFASGSLISHFTDWLPLYTTPPQRKLLTGEQIEFAWMKAMQSTPGTTLPIHEFARAIEQAYGMPEQSIDDLVAEFEATPKGAEAMQHGREWVKDLQSEQPVGYVYWAKGHAEGAIDVQTLKPGTPLYTRPPQRKPLSEEEIKEAVLDDPIGGAVLLGLMRDEVTVTQLRQAINLIARATEAAHEIKEKP